MNCPLPFPGSFTECLVHLNCLRARGFQNWTFQPGMLFGALTTWWPSGATARPRPHEGIDLYSFVGHGGAIGALGPGTMIPALGGGVVVAIFADFLGQSILVGHDWEEGGAKFHSIYAHLTPEPGVALGQRCHDAEAIGRIAVSQREGVPAHLHLSTLWLAAPLAGEVSWPRINAAARLCDPMEYIGA